MSLVTDFSTYSEEIKISSEELNAYFSAAGFDWLRHGTPDFNKPLPQASIDTWYETVSTGKARSAYTTYVVWVSFWHLNNLDESVKADEMSKMFADLLHNTKSSTGLFVQYQSRQPTVDTDAAKARVRIQFKVTRI